jgi:tetratricopeptide (TPR) repeat protein
MLLRLIASAVLLVIPAVPTAQNTAIELDVTGEHRLAAGDTGESAREFARLDAHRRAVRAVAAALQKRADFAALKLAPVEWDAYAAGLIETEEPPAAASQGPAIVRVTLRARFDTNVQRLSNLHKDEDVSRTLVNAWTKAERMYQGVAEQTKRRASQEQTAAAAATVRAQLEAVATLNASRLAARGSAARAKTEPTTVGGRASSPEGRRRARELAGAALALAPASIDAHMLLGDLWIDEEQPDAAEAEYRLALAGDPKSVAARTKVAEALRLQGKFDESVVDLREAIRIDPTFAPAHSDLGMILREQKNITEAVAAYREAIRLDPRSTDARNGLAITYAGSGRLEEARAEFQAIVEIDPESTIGYYNLATALANLDRDVEAAAALREVIRINPNHYNARYNIGELLRLEGKFDDSAAQFREYLRLAPDTPQNRRNINRARQFVEKFTGQ